MRPRPIGGRSGRLALDPDFSRVAPHERKMSDPASVIPALGGISPEVPKILLVLFLSFLIGLEREGRVTGDAPAGFGGVRTFPLIGMMGYAMALLAGPQILAVAIGFIGIAAFLLLSYSHKLSKDSSGAAGVTSEMSALATYLIGALVSHELFWIGTTLAVASMILLELKTALEGLARRISADDIFTFTKFLLLTAVVLPVVPNESYTEFSVNPYRTWIVVVAVSAISYGSYVVQKLSKGQGGVLLTAVLGGAYSSTLTTIVLSRRATPQSRAHTVSGAILMASGVMYLRLCILLLLFNRTLMVRLAPSFIVLALTALITGMLWAHRDVPGEPMVPNESERTPANPLELRAALLFAILFVAMIVAGHLAATHLGPSGVYTLATVMGVTDVDPFILSMTQTPGLSPAADVAASAIVIAAASNNLAKALYARLIAPRSVGRMSLWLLLGLALAGLVPLAR